MAHKYDTIGELDDEMNGGQRLPEMSVGNYMIPPPSWELGGSPIKMDHIKNYMITPRMGVNSHRPKVFVKCANSSNRVRAKNIRTGVLIEFDKMVNAARFVGTTGANMRCGFGYAKARVYHVGGEEYVFEYDGKERPLGDGSRWSSLDGSIEIVSRTRERTLLFSYLSVAKYLGLLVGHILEEEKRELAKKYVLGKETYTIEFKRERRRKDNGKGIVCHWKGIYDGDFEGISGIKVTYGKPIKRECLTI